MRAPPALLAAAALFALVVGCMIAVNEPAGQPCESRDDCTNSSGEVDTFYDCVAPGPEAQRTCQLIWPPLPQDAGTGQDAGSVEAVFWCDTVEALMVKYCADCHGVDRSFSGQPFRLDVYADESASLPGAFSMASAIKRTTTDVRKMPPPTLPMPTDFERRQIGDWVRGGARLCADGGM